MSDPSDGAEEAVPCPHCGESNGDLFELSDLKSDGDETETDCGSCGKLIRVQMSVTYEYRSSKP